MSAARPGIAIVRDPAGPDHFAGVGEALREQGVTPDWIAGGERPPRLAAGTRVVAVADVRSFAILNLLRQARRLEACTVLMMDGILEYRNTFENPRAGEGFLQPAPVDIIACAGKVDARRLRELCNDAVPTGLPRLMRIAPMPQTYLSLERVGGEETEGHEKSPERESHFPLVLVICRGPSFPGPGGSRGPGWAQPLEEI